MQFLMNYICAEQPVLERREGEHPGPKKLIPAGERNKTKGRKGQRPTVKRQNGKRLN